AKDSQDFLETWLGKSDKERENLVLQNLHNNLTITNGDWKYIKPGPGPRYYDKTDTEYGNSEEPQLYNLKDDIREQNNLAQEYPEKVKELHAKMMEIIEEK
ncbi:MAG: arylsulfatase, partial [Bacteroides sp.]